MTVAPAVAGPVAPVAPVGPVAPVAPLAPAEPVSPVGPRGPVAPVAPFVPLTPVAPGGTGRAGRTSRKCSSAELAVGVDENRIAAALVDSVYAGDVGVGLISVANANGVCLACNPIVANIDIVIARSEVGTGVRSEADVIAAGGAKKRAITDGRVVAAAGVIRIERKMTVGRVVGGGWLI